jgi:polygalacturonase
MTIVRAQEGTSAQSFLTGSRIELRVTVGNVEGGTYTPDGSGAVSRTLQAKLRETVSVKDFGAVGDGSDETSKVQLA